MNEHQRQPQLQFRSIDLNVDISTIADCYKRVILDLNSRLAPFRIEDVISSRSASLRETLNKVTEDVLGLAWVKTPVTSMSTFSGISMPTAIFQIDGTFSCQRKCGATHTADFVLCLNNRESIGTTYLKLESIYQRRILELQNASDQKVFNLSILVTASENLLSLGKWDPSYGDTHEHKEAFQKVYRPLLQSNYMIVEIDSL